jgi:hypothetical protein
MGAAARVRDRHGRTSENHEAPIAAWRERFGTFREGTRYIMVDPSATASSSATEQEDLRPRARALSWMASLSVAAGELRAAEGYLLELLAWCAFGERELAEASADE